MVVVTLYGSMLYQNEMIKIARNLEVTFGYCVLQCVYDFAGKNDTQKERDKIIRAHYKKIDLCDFIYVVNIDGFISESTQKEIEYAIKKGKEVYYHEDREDN